MGRAPCCDKTAVKRGFWTTEEDRMLVYFIHRNGHGNWRALPKQAGLLRCGKSCRLRWINYLCPNIRRGNFSVEEEEAIIKLHQVFGNRWSAIASRLPGRTDNEIKNVWNTHLKKSHLRTRIEMPSTTKDSPADDLGIKFSCQKKVSTDSPTTISNLSESHKPLNENFPCVSNMDSESMTEDSASTSEWPQWNCLNSLVGCDRDLSTIGHDTNLEDLLKDERIILENQNFEDERIILENQKFEDEERWFYMQGENAITWEQNSNLNAHYFMSSYPEDDILSSRDCEGALLKGMFEGGDDDDYWLNVLSQVGQSTLLSFAS